MIRIVSHYYSHRYSDVPADIICCRHVLEHIQDPLSFLRGLVGSNKARDPVYFFEVPDFSWSLLESAFWDVYHEHCTYFSSTSLRFLFSVSGFRVLQIRNGFYGQYLLLELERYASFVTPGSCIVVFDGLMRILADAPNCKSEWA